MICETCNQISNCNRYRLCPECAQAYDDRLSDQEVKAIFTASFALKDIIPVSELELEDEENTGNFYSGVRRWRHK